MAVAAPPVARSAAKSGASAARAANKRDAPGPPARAKLKVGAANDPLERDADAAADKVMRAPVPSFPMAGPEKPSSKDDKVRRKTEKSADGKRGTARRAEAADQTRKASTAQRAEAKGGGNSAKKPTAQRATKADQASGRKEDRAQRAMAKPGKKTDATAQRAAKSDEKQATARRTSLPDLEETAQTKRKDTAQARSAKSREPSSQPPKAQRASAKPGKSENETVRRDSAGSDAGAPPAGFEAAVGRVQQSSGTTLPDQTRQTMESGFGRSFEGVSIHTDGGAQSAAQSIDARAFTLGNSIFFGPGQYQPQTSDGRRLIAHELAHVAQQSGGLAQPMVRRDGTDDTTQPVTTAAPAGSPTLAPTQPPGPPEFVGRDGRRIVRQDTGGKKGTVYLPALKVPFVEGGPKGASNHPMAAIAGQAGPDRNVLTQGQPFELKGKTERSSQSARRKWIAGAQADAEAQSGITAAITTRFGAGTPPPASGTATPAAAPAEGEAGEPAPLAQGNQSHYYLKPARNDGAPFFVVGNTEQLARHELVVLPVWDKRRTRHDFDVDHILELQLGGLDGYENFWVLDAAANRSSGSNIHNTLSREVDALIREANGAQFWTNDKGGPKPTDYSEMKSSWLLHFDRIEELPINKSSYAFWTKPEIRQGDHLTGLQAMTDRQIAQAGLRFTPGVRPTALNVFTNPAGGFFKGLRRTGDNWRPAGADEFYKGFDQVAVTINDFDAVEEGREVGRITGRAFHKASKTGKIFDAPNIPIPLLQSPNLGFGVYADKRNLNVALAALRMKKASPVAIDDAGLSAAGVLFVEGRIIASIPLLQGIEIPFSIDGDEISITFPLPLAGRSIGPVQITESSLEIGASADGLFLAGSLGFLLQGVGSGRLQARAGNAEEPAPPGGGGAAAAAPGGTGGEAAAAPGATEPGFSFDGAFNFDSEALDPASIAFAYHHHQLVVDATVGLKPGVVRGIDQSEIHVRSSETGILFEGFATLGIPSLQGTRLTVSRNEQGEIAIGADNIPLPVDRIPGVSSATANVHVVRNTDTGEWSVSGGGTAAIAIAGVSGDLGVAIAGPFVTIRGDNITISRPPLTGSGAFLVSNQPRDAAGNPIEGEPTDMVASGHIEASLPLGRYLRGTIGGTILPNGELLFSGGVSLPSSVDLFDRQAYERVLFRPPSLDIPIFGITAAGQRVGIFATIGGSLTFSAGIGPGQIRDARLFAIFNPDRPEETEVHGGATFVVPADAGLRLAINGGIGAGIPVVSAEAGIEIGASLGLVAEASAEVGVDWTPSDGLSLSATASLNAQPQFTFDISAYLRITADVLITEFDLYDERWQLGSFTFGPELAVGVDVPISWSEQNGLDFDVNQIDVRYPEIDFQALGSDLIAQLVGE
jgi:hypothetical protein